MDEINFLPNYNYTNFVGCFGGLIEFLFLDTESTETILTNFTKLMNNEITPHEIESIVKTNTKLWTLSLIIIIGVLINIWPTNQSIKVGK